MAAEIRLFPCLTDNFGYLIHDPATGATASIGQGVPEAVLWHAGSPAGISKNGFELRAEGANPAGRTATAHRE